MLGSNENPIVEGGGSGGEVSTGVSFDDTTMMLTINIGWGSGMGFTDLTGNITGLHVHDSGAANGFDSNGGVEVALSGFTASATNGGYSGSVTLTSTQAAELLNNQYYLNGHTSTNAGGEIRGHLVQQVPEPSSTALLGLGGLALLARRRK